MDADTRLPWLIRDNPNQIGALTRAKVLTALIAAGKTVLAPVVNVERYDLVPVAHEPIEDLFAMMEE